VGMRGGGWRQVGVGGIDGRTNGQECKDEKDVRIVESDFFVP
jgi:hypothetical protein